MKIKDWAVVAVFAATLSLLSIVSLLSPDQDVSKSERRHLTQFAAFSEKKQEANAKGQSYGLPDYFSFLESYSLDQFPARDFFRSVKSVFKLEVLRQRDNNRYYSVHGSLSMMDPEINTAAVTDAARRFNALYEKYFRRLRANAYYCVIPDKNAHLAEANGYLHFDYPAFYQLFADAMNANIQPIDIALSTDSYYRTDPHWDQSKLLPVADTILLAMGAESGVSGMDWQVHALEPFYGTYWGQLALPVSPDSMKYLTIPQFDAVTVYDYAAGKNTALYRESNFQNIDPYDVFLEGAVPLLKVENPNSISQKQLVVFRDSFGSSLIPLLTPEYAEILVIDIRYLSPERLLTMVRFRPECDVLFLYSSTVLNTYGIFQS